MSAILPSATIAHAENLPDDIYNSIFGETIPVNAADSTTYSGNTYTIKPRVGYGDENFSDETGVRFIKDKDPNDGTKKINKSITYQVVSKDPYGRNYRTWRTEKIFVSLSVYDESIGMMIPHGFYIRPLPLQNITDATTQITFSEDQVIRGMRESWLELMGINGYNEAIDLEENVRKSFQYGCGLSVGADLATIWVPKVLEPLKISDLPFEDNILRLLPYSANAAYPGGMKPKSRSELESEARAWANTKSFKYPGKFVTQAMTRVKLPETKFDSRCLNFGPDLKAEDIIPTITLNGDTATVTVKNISGSEKLKDDTESELLLTAQNITAKGNLEKVKFQGLTDEGAYHAWTIASKMFKKDGEKVEMDYSFPVKRTEESQVIELYLDVNIGRNPDAPIAIPGPKPIEQNYENNYKSVKIIIPPLAKPDLVAESVTPTYDETTGQLCATGVGSAVGLAPNNLVLPTDHVIGFSGLGSNKGTTVSNTTKTNLTECISRPQTDKPQKITVSYTINPDKTKPTGEVTYTNNTVTQTIVIPPKDTPIPPIPPQTFGTTCKDYEDGPPYPNKGSHSEKRSFGDGTGEPKPIYEKVGTTCVSPSQQYAHFEWIDNKPDERDEMGEWAYETDVPKFQLKNPRPDSSCGCKTERCRRDSDGDRRCTCIEYNNIYDLYESFEISVKFRASVAHEATSRPYSMTVNSNDFKAGYGFATNLFQMYFTDWDGEVTGKKAWIRRPNGSAPLYKGDDVNEPMEPFGHSKFDWRPPSGTLGAGISPGTDMREYYTNVNYPDGIYELETWSTILFYGGSSDWELTDCRYNQLTIKGNMWEDYYSHPSDPGRPTDGKGNQLGTDEWGKTTDWRFEKNTNDRNKNTNDGGKKQNTPSKDKNKNTNDEF